MVLDEALAADVGQVARVVTRLSRFRTMRHASAVEGLDGEVRVGVDERAMLVAGKERAPVSSSVAREEGSFMENTRRGSGL
ncbi:MAG: hypothetical protein ACK57B_07335 [Betaproteobacteria bacterium]|jgi:hypothetical protein